MSKAVEETDGKGQGGPQHGEEGTRGGGGRQEAQLTWGRCHRSTAMMFCRSDRPRRTARVLCSAIGIRALHSRGQRTIVFVEGASREG